MRINLAQTYVGLQPSTQIYNSCMWAADKGGHWELAIKMLEDMEREQVYLDVIIFYLFLRSPHGGHK